ncbi:S-adenosyl-L-methionine-dependent methyltransferase [Xylaria sp. CBS 124048]|nr:S-adenosyl-L-methionine-dependent methyltransferase [Xylaria sp. CBS 124048]
MAKVIETLGKLSQNLAADASDEQLDRLIADSERIMRLPGALLLAQAGLDASTNEPFLLLDHACGTGPIAAHLQENIDENVLSRSKMLCADINGKMVDIVKKRVDKSGWGNVGTAHLDAQDSGLPTQSFSHVTLNFAMHMIPNPEAVLQDAMRVLKPGGILAFSVWHKDNEGWMPDMRSCFETLPFETPMLEPMPMAPNGKQDLVDPELLPACLVNAGFEAVKVQTVKHIVPMQGAEDFLKCFGMMKGWMVGAYWSEETKRKAEGMLDDHIVKHLAEKHGGGGWDLTWTLILATCRKPNARE